MDLSGIIEDDAKKSLETHGIYCKLHVDTSELDAALQKTRELIGALSEAARLTPERDLVSKAKAISAYCDSRSDCDNCPFWDRGCYLDTVPPASWTLPE